MLVEYNDAVCQEAMQDYNELIFLTLTSALLYYDYHAYDQQASSRRKH